MNDPSEKPSRLDIKPFAGPASGQIRPPGSKSITNRALVCAALADGSSILTGALDSEDTRVMIDALVKLGINVQVEGDGTTVRVSGCGGKIPEQRDKFVDLYIANSGTTMRFLAAMVSLGHGSFRLHGTKRMHERPIQDLLDALEQLRVDAKCEQGKGFPPVVVNAAGMQGGDVIINTGVSSQFLSGLLLAAPCAKQKIGITNIGPMVSEPYVRMTVAVMERFGAKLNPYYFGPNFTQSGPYVGFNVEPTRYTAQRYSIEPDASAASYFLAAAAITGGSVTIEGLFKKSLQGDVHFVDRLERMGCQVSYDDRGITVTGGELHGIDVNMNAISDTAQTLAAVALFAKGTTKITGIAHVRHKETDRIAALATELRKFGAKVTEQDDGLTIEPPEELHGATIDTYDDHRMAMSMALVGLKVPGVVINDPGCTAKTYPGFFADLENLRP